MNYGKMITIEQVQRIYLQRQEEVAGRTGTIRRIVLYNDGNVCKDSEERGYEHILYDIPVPPYYYNLKSRLLYCYADGHVNIMTPKTIFDNQLRNGGIKKNGFNTKKGIQLMNVFVCKEDDFLVVFSLSADGKTRLVRADRIKKRKSHGSMVTPGNEIIREARPYKWMVIPGELERIVKPILRTGHHAGIPLEAYAYAGLLGALDQFTGDLTLAPIIAK